MTKPDNRIIFRLPIPEIKELKKLAHKKGMTRSEYMRYLIKRSEEEGGF